MRRLWLLILLLVVWGCAAAPRPHLPSDDDANTVYPPACGSVANPNSSGCSSFGTSLYTYLTKEKAGEDVEAGYNNFVSNIVNSNACLGVTGASLVMTPSSCIAYNAGIRGTETGSITFPNASTTWVAMDENTSGNNAGLPNFTRVAGTHYLIDSIDVTQPQMAADSQLLMKVVTSGGAITAVTDLRGFNSITASSGQGTVQSGTGPAIAQYISGTHTTVGPATVSGDATIAQGGALTVTKSNGVAFATSATTDATNASNISSGTLNNSRLPTTITQAHLVGSIDITDTGLTPSRCVQTGTGGILTVAAAACATTAGIAQGGPLTQNLATGGFELTGLPCPIANGQQETEGCSIGAVLPSNGNFNQLTTLQAVYNVQQTLAEAGGGSLGPALTSGPDVLITIADSSAFTISNALPGPSSGQNVHWTIILRNNSAGAAGAITLGANYRTDSSWGAPAAGKTRVCSVVTNVSAISYIGPCTGDETN